MTHEQVTDEAICSLPYGIGHDIESIQWVEDMMKEPPEIFLDKVFTPEEIARYGKKPESLAARWAGKEAVGKALGVGITRGKHKEIEILDERGRPKVILHGVTAQRAAEMGFKRIDISLSHEHRRLMMASAFVTAMGICPFLNGGVDKKS